MSHHIRYTAFASFARAFSERSRAPGLAIGISEHGETVHTEALGYRDLAKQLPVTEETVFGVASVTKSFAALAIMQLEDAGRLSVDDPVIKWLPEFRVPDPAANKAITIHHLMTHTAGLPGMAAIFHARAASIRRDPDAGRLGLDLDPYAVEPIETYAELMDVMARSEYKLLGAPGACFNYSNESYGLLQGIIERASGQNFLTYMQEHVLDPIGMERSCFRTTDLTRYSNVTELYSPTPDGEVIHSPAWWDVGRIYTNGSLKSTVRDLLRYLDLYRTGGLVGEHRILSERSVRKMTTPYVTLPNGRQYGYGLELQPDYRGISLIGHGGSIKGVSSHVLLAPSRGIATVVLCNLDGVAAGDVALGAVNAAVGLPPETRRWEYPPVEIAGLDLEEYTGFYRSEEGEATLVTAEDGLLAVKGSGRVQPYGPDRFVSLDGKTPVVFLRDGAGRIFGLHRGMRILLRR